MRRRSLRLSSVHLRSLIIKMFSISFGIGEMLVLVLLQEIFKHQALATISKIQQQKLKQPTKRNEGYEGSALSETVSTQKFTSKAFRKKVVVVDPRNATDLLGKVVLKNNQSFRNFNEVFTGSPSSLNIIFPGLSNNNVKRQKLQNISGKGESQFFHCGNLTCNTTIKHTCTTDCCDKQKNCTAKPKRRANETQLIDILVIAGFVLVFVIGTIGNAVVCFLFGWVRRKQRSIPETLFFYLGIADLISSIVNPFVFIYRQVTPDGRWDFGFIGCKILSGIGPVAASLSSIFISIIALDRYFAITNPFKRRYSKKGINRTSALGVLFACLMHFHYIYYVEYNKTTGRCGITNPSVMFGICGIISFVVQDMICFLIFVVTYLKIMKALKKHGQEKYLKKLCQKREQDHKSIARILKLIGFLFFLCVLPRDLFHVIYTISWLLRVKLYYIRHINSVLKIIHTSNSCLNVFIYSRIDKQFGRSLFTLSYCSQKDKSKEKEQKIPLNQRTENTTIDFTKKNMLCSLLPKNSEEEKETSI